MGRGERVRGCTQGVGRDKRKHERKGKSTCWKDHRCDSRDDWPKKTGDSSERLRERRDRRQVRHKTVVYVSPSCIEVWSHNKEGKNWIKPSKNVGDLVWR